jgi:hypothetical protein
VYLLANKEQDYRERLRNFLRIKILRLAKMTYQEIANELGVSRQRANKISKRWPYPRGPHPTGQCSASSSCTHKVALRNLCPKHYAQRFRKVIADGDTAILLQISRYSR